MQTNISTVVAVIILMVLAAVQFFWNIVLPIELYTMTGGLALIGLRTQKIPRNINPGKAPYRSKTIIVSGVIILYSALLLIRRDLPIELLPCLFAIAILFLATTKQNTNEL